MLEMPRLITIIVVMIVFAIIKFSVVLKNKVKIKYIIIMLLILLLVQTYKFALNEVSSVIRCPVPCIQAICEYSYLQMADILSQKLLNLKENLNLYI
jgi:hypothetical protein